MARRRTAGGNGAESGGVVEWRRTRLLAAGVAPPLALELAASGDVDLHALLELIDRGCPPELAARILAPLDRPIITGRAR